MHLSLPAKIFLAFAALSLSFGATLGLGLWQLHVQTEAVRGLHQSLVPMPRYLAQLSGELHSLDVVLEQSERATLRRSVHLVRRVQPALPAAFAQLTQAQRALAHSHAPPAAQRLIAPLGALSRALAAFEPELERFFELAEASPDGALIERARQTARQSLHQLLRQVGHLDDEIKEALETAVAALGRAERRATWIVFALMAGTLLVGLLTTIAAGRLLRPLQTLRLGVERVARGDYGAVALPTERGEIAQLAEAFNRMAAALRERDEMLESKQRQLLHRERLAAVGHLSAQITHELRNPLTSIGLNSELLMEELEPMQPVAQRESAQSLLENIIREVERLRDITEAYLGFARLPQPQPMATDLNLLAADLVDFVASEMRQAQLRVRCDADPGGRAAWVDPNQMRSALLNLVRNAREALQPGGRITVRVRSLGETATLAVLDDGAGIPPSAQERLFEPFFTTKQAGTGLGLPMVQKIVQAQGGWIELNSEPGRGTEVIMHLPLAPPGTTPQAPAQG